jgi:hypothetical protein
MIQGLLELGNDIIKEAVQAARFDADRRMFVIDQGRIEIILEQVNEPGACLQYLIAIACFYSILHTSLLNKK